MTQFDKIYGCLLGGAVGDALGLPVEKLTPMRQKALYGSITEMQFLPGRGLLSDDTEHALFTARALVESRGEGARFRRLLTSEFRRWMLALPPGIGLATLRAGCKAVLFLPRSGVYSAGNGPAMRAPILGVALASAPPQLREYLEISIRLTHTDPKAFWGSALVAIAAGSEKGADGRALVREFEQWSDNSSEANECLQWLKKVVNSAAQGQTTAEFCAAWGLQKGVSGYIYHTVPVVMQCYFRNHTDMRAALEEIVACGGDTDSTAAILGGIMGAQLGAAAVPRDWKESIWDWPNSARSIEILAREVSDSLEEGYAVMTPRLIWPFQLLRNFFFALIVLAHGFRRMLPPYR